METIKCAVIIKGTSCGPQVVWHSILAPFPQKITNKQRHTFVLLSNGTTTEKKNRYRYKQTVKWVHMHTPTRIHRESTVTSILMHSCDGVWASEVHIKMHMNNAVKTYTVLWNDSNLGNGRNQKCVWTLTNSRKIRTFPSLYMWKNTNIQNMLLCLRKVASTAFQITCENPLGLNNRPVKKQWTKWRVHCECQLLIIEMQFQTKSDNQQGLMIFLRQYAGISRAHD